MLGTVFNTYNHRCSEVVYELQEHRKGQKHSYWHIACTQHYRGIVPDYEKLKIENAYSEDAEGYLAAKEEKFKKIAKYNKANHKK